MLKFFFDNFTEFLSAHLRGVYCKPCLQPITCVFLIFVSDLNFEYISCGSRQYLLISSKKHVYVSPDCINGIKKAVTIILLFLQLK